MFIKDDEDDFIEDMIAYHIIMDSEKRDKKSPKGSGGCLSWVLFIAMLIFVIAVIGQCTGCG